MAVLIITHDLGVVANLADDVVVMYHGRVVESGTCDDIFARPQHPYLKALFTAVPRTNMAPGERLVPIRQIAPGKASLMRKKSEVSGNGADPGPLLTVKGLTKRFTLRNQGFFGFGSERHLLAVDDVSFEVRRGECLGLVGESGCGKTTASKLILRGLSTDAGEVTYYDQGRPVDVLALNDEALKAFRRRVQFIFQDPFGSLNPRMTALDIVCEPLVVHKVGTPAERIEMVKELMRLVGLDVRFLRRYPHSFSGGQRQRLGIARALALQPDLLICDEPVSSLDVSIQAQILNLLKDLQSELGLTFLFISHNLAVVDYMSDRIAVMYRGRLVEIAPRATLFANPIHPYTRTLLAAVPYPDPDRKLDYASLSASKASSSADFPAPFTLTEDTPSELIGVGDGHYVRAAANSRPEVLLL
jgi:peptide/nickel transport system ATP-binding protein